jgi:arabinan endo-1,5-alpha-L-arabinosidase
MEQTVSYTVPPDAPAGIYGVFAYAGATVDAPVEFGTMTVTKAGDSVGSGLAGLSSSLDNA